MNRLLKYILTFLAIALSVSYVVFAGEKSQSADQQKVCSNMTISITDYEKKMLISNEEIAILLKEKELNPIGKSLERIKTKAIEEVIEKHPMVRHAECYKTPGGTVHIVIEQRTPVLRVIGLENYYVDDLRKPMPISTNYAAYVPVVTGRVTKKMATGGVFEFAQFLNNDDFWGNQIEQININDRMKVELVPRVGNHIIVLGDLDRFQQKMEKLRKFYQFGLNEIGWNIYSTIDLQYKDQVVCTKN